jgi:hypothetical protein
MDQAVDWTLHLTCDKANQPEFAWVTCEVPYSNGAYWIADVEFSPFETTWDVARWLVRTLNAHRPVRPS